MIYTVYHPRSNTYYPLCCNLLGYGDTVTIAGILIIDTVMELLLSRVLTYIIVHIHVAFKQSFVRIEKCLQQFVNSTILGDQSRDGNFEENNLVHVITQNLAGFKI